MLPFLLASLSLAASCAVAQSPSPSSLDPDIEYTTVTPYWTDQPTAYPLPDDLYWPTRPVKGSYGADGGGTPMHCLPVCMPLQGIYGVCVLNATVPRGPPREGRVLEISLENCLAQLCEPGYYNQLYQCLNCIVANGGESTRPPAPPRTRTSTTSATASASATPEWTVGTPWPAVNADNANGWFANITEYCQANGRDTAGFETTITATPTASAVYRTGYGDGETVNIPNWTELTTISELLASLNADYRSAAVAAITSRRSPPEASQTGAGARTGASVLPVCAVAAVAAVAVGAAI